MPPSDVIRRLSDELARDPASDAFLPLAELLDGQGRTEAALRVARQGASRHPSSVEAQALLARVALGAEEWAEADAAWTRVTALATSDVARAAAHEGRAYACFRLGRPDEATRQLDAAAAAGADPQRVAAARRRMAAQGASDARSAPALVPQVARELAAVGEQATRAMRHLALGEWQRIVVETEDARVGLAPTPEGVLLGATPAGAPLGQLGRLLDAALRPRAAREAQP